MKRGRPSLGKVVYKRRVSPALVSVLDGVIKGPDSPSYAFPVVQTPFKEDNLKALEPHASTVVSPNVKALLEDAERLERENAKLMELNQRIAHMSDDDKFHASPSWER